MTEHSDAPLKWDLFVTSGIPTVTPNPPPGEKRRFFSPISSTLIYGKRDAVLVDTFMTVDQNDVLVDWVKASGKNLMTIYITHGHGDHWFGIGALLERFPGARAVASPAVVNMMKEQSPDVLKSWWQARLPGQIPDSVVIAEELAGNVVNLEGQDLVVVDREPILHGGGEFAHQHREAAIADERDRLPARVCDLRGDRVRQTRCHAGQIA